MNKDAEATEKFLAWLLQDSPSEPSTQAVIPSGHGAGRVMNRYQTGAPSQQWPTVDPLDSEDTTGILASLVQSGSLPLEKISLFNFGEKLAVQDRFFALLKRRLRTEIERNPPLFPWESEEYDYESESTAWTAAGLASAQVWVAQLKNLTLPVPMPEAVLASLFERCQAVVQSSLRDGVKLVQAVESLFPGQSSSLNHLAGLVLAAPSRSPLTQTRKPDGSGFPEHYNVATPAQRMLLSLLAARDLLEATTFRVSNNQPRITRPWQTAAGELTLDVQYQPETGGLRVQGQLPCQGNFLLQGQADQAMTHRASAGHLSVELFDVTPNQPYSLEIRLDNGPDSAPLLFAVCPIIEN